MERRSKVSLNLTIKFFSVNIASVLSAVSQDLCYIHRVNTVLMKIFLPRYGLNRRQKDPRTKTEET